MSWARAATWLVGAPLLLCLPSFAASAAPPRAADDLARGEVLLRAASSEASPSDRRKTLASALAHFESSFGTEPSWPAAAGASEANLQLGSSACAAGWYWLATDHADYSDRYLAWQTGALTSVFEQRAMFTFELPGPAATLRVDGFSVPIGAADRALAFDVGAHTVLATSAEGEAFQGTLDVAPEQVGGRYFFPVAFGKMLRAGEEDPNLPRGKTRPDPPDTSMSALQIGTIIGTVALASGIAVGGGYLLFGEENPRGLDTVEGAVVVVTELLVIGAGTLIALLSDG